ncbi:MAG: glycine cleavage system protein GcvH [Verrucomicrobiota bacterium]|nr:glycine cleavage system protein GcvH [Verrucomicrobiota bacterium]
MTERRFTKSHEWIEVKGRVGTVGITHYAQKELGDIVYAQLPKVGQVLRAGQEVCVLESTKAAADIYTPVSGKVVAINEKVREEPALTNRDAEHTGWLFQIELSSAKEVDSLLTRVDYDKMIANS